ARSPLVNPQVVGVVQVDIRQQRRNRCTLRRANTTRLPAPLLQNSRLQPFLDETQESPVCNSVLEKTEHPLVVDGVEKSTNVCVEHPVHLPPSKRHRQRVQRVVLSTSGAEPGCEAAHVSSVSGLLC